MLSSHAYFLRSLTFNFKFKLSSYCYRHNKLIATNKKSIRLITKYKRTSKLITYLNKFIFLNSLFLFL